MKPRACTCENTHAHQWKQKVLFSQELHTLQEGINWQIDDIFSFTLIYLKYLNKCNRITLYSSPFGLSLSLSFSRSHIQTTNTLGQTGKYAYSKLYPDNTPGRHTKYTSSFDALWTPAVSVCGSLWSAGYHKLFLSFVCICVLLKHRKPGWEPW